MCGSGLQRGHSGDGCLSSSILFKYERSRGHLFVLSSARIRRVALGSVFSEQCTVSVKVALLCCRLLRYVLSVVEVCVVGC